MGRWYAALAALATLAGGAAGALERLADADFERRVHGPGAGPWLVEFGRGPEPAAARAEALREAARALEGSGVSVAYVDAAAEPQCAAGHAGLQLFGPSPDPIQIAPPATHLQARAVVDKTLAQVAAVVLERLGGGAEPGAGSKAKPKTQQNKEKSKPKNKFNTRGKPLQLDDANFDSTVLQADEAFIVAFIAPWCGHCRALAPEYAQAAQQLEGTGVIVAEVDATANERLSQRFGIQGFPTIKFFPPGVLNKGDHNVIEYQQARSADAIVSWSLAEFERHGGQVTIDIPEITSQADFDELCEESKCVLMFVPDLYDTGKAGRDELIAALEDAQRNARHIKFGWLAAGSQPQFEEAYHLSFGFPAVLYLRRHQAKDYGLIMRGSSLSASALAAFASSAKKLGEFDEAPWPAIVPTEPWDGQEPPPLPEDEDDDFDLEAFLNDED